MGGKTSLLVGLALSAGLAGAQQAPMSYDLRRPLCQQLQMGPELLAALTPPPLSGLGLPAAVKPLPRAGTGSDVAAVHFDTKPNGGAAAGPGGLPPAAVAGGPAPVTVTLTPEVLMRQLSSGWSPELETALAATEPKVLAKMLGEAAAKSGNYVPTTMLATALVASGYDLLAPGALTPAARDAVTDRLSAIGDARVLPLGEAALAEWGQRDAPVVPVGAMAAYYRRQQQYDKAAATWLRGPEHTTSPGYKLDYQVSAGVDLMRAGDAKRGTELVGQATAQGIAAGLARRLASTIGVNVMRLGDMGSPDLAEALMAAAEPLGKTELAPVWQCQRCYLLLLRGRIDEARGICATAMVDAQARLAAATPEQRDGCAMDLSAVRDLDDWFVARDGHTLIARPARIRLTPGAAMTYLTLVTRSKGTLTLTSSVPWLTCQVLSASPGSGFVPAALRGCKYAVLARPGQGQPAAGQGEVTLRWVDGDQSAELKLPVTLGDAAQPQNPPQ